MASDAANFTRALLGQGLLMGWGDEAEAWLRSKIGEKTYEDELADINREYGEFAKRRPIASLATEFAGGAVPTVLALTAAPFTGGATAPAAAAAGARATGVLARLANNPVVRGAVTGATTGAVSGAGAAQPGERGEGALTGAQIGGVLGAAAPLVIRGGGAGYEWLRDRVAPSADVVMQNATRRINRALSEAREGRGMTPADAEVMMIEDRLRGIPSTFANVDPALVDLAETAAQRSGASARIVEGTLGRQTAGARERVYGRAKSELGGGNYYDDEARMVEDLRNKASTLYDDAYAFGSVMDPRIMSALKNTKFKGFYDKAREIAETEKMAAKLRGEDTSKFELEELYKFDKEGNIVGVNVPDVRTLDYIKRGIDATIDSGFRGQGMSTAEANALKDLRKQFVNALDEATVDPQTGRSAYKTARKVYAGDMEVLDAMRMGRDKFNSMDSEEIAKAFDEMGQAERDAFQTGAIRSIYDVVMKSPNNINAAQKLIGSPEYSAKLKEIFDSPAQFDLFKAALEREAQLFAQSNRILGGSATARRTAAREAFEEGSPVGGVVADTLTTGFGNSMANLVARIARSATMTDDTAKEVSRMLMSSDPTEVAAAVKLLEDYGARAVKSEQKLGAREAGAIVGATTAVPPPPATEESPNIKARIQADRETAGTQGGPSIEEAVRERKKKREEGLNITIDSPADGIPLP
jgi:hypothetical protein